MRKIKKLKIYGIVSLGLFFVTCGFVMWLSLSAITFMSFDSKLENIPMLASEKIALLEKEVSQITTQQIMGCWTKIESLIAIQPWLEQSTMIHLEELKDSCLGKQLKEEPVPRYVQKDSSNNVK